MLRLILFRHAKALRARSGMPDFDRALAPEGQGDARNMGRLMIERAFLPDSILCSSALRTKQTLQCALPAMADKVEFRDDLYHVSAAGYPEVLRANGHSSRTLMVVGHNPVIHDAALELVGTGDPRLIAEMIADFPTAAVAVINFDALNWRDIASASGSLVAFFHPN